MDLLNGILLVVLGYVIGSFVAEYKSKIFMTDLFCTFIRVYGLVWSDVNRGDYNLDEHTTSYLLNKFKIFLEVALNKETLQQIKKDLEKEGR
jgi:putative effector of murein hydrolase